MRYADDIAIFASSQRSAERILESVVKWLGKELKLEVNRTKSGAGPTEQSGLLGFRIDEEGTIEIGDQAIQRLKERVHELWDARQSKTSQQLSQQQAYESSMGKTEKAERALTWLTRGATE